MGIKFSSMENLARLKKKFFRKKVFLTGHTGFKGSWLLTILKFIGARVKGYSLEPKDLSLFNKINGENLCESIIGDINNKSLLQEELLKFKPDFIFHFAAQALVNESYINPVNTFNTNIIGTVNLLDSIRSLRNKCSTVIITTDKVYKNKETLRPYTEKDQLGGYDPYSSSKSCVELITESYRNSFFHLKKINLHKKAFATARAGNVIGGGDWSNGRIVKDIINAIELNKPIKLRYPNSIRPWQHVLEPLNAYLELATKLNENPINYSTTFNFGPLIDDCISVKLFTEKMKTEWGSDIEVLIDKNNINHETGALILDIEKAKKLLDWKPKTNIDAAISQTISWYKNNNLDAIKKCEMQIEQFYTNYN